MFRNLANYLLGTTAAEQVADGVEDNVRLSANCFEDDWVLVDRDSEGNSDVESLESLDDDDDDGRRHEERVTLTRTSSTSSLPRAIMEESWFLTPPPCFTSAGPVHMETSPLENLLIEHPSMSVYNSQQVFIARRPNNLPVVPVQQVNPVAIIDENDIIVLDDDDDVQRPVRVANHPRRNRVETLRQQERQCIKTKQAQKVNSIISSCLT